ncbi:MAG: hypothetical protein AB1704_20240 [Pseudomonadota bacterium]|jgi:hypothetical protein
MSTISDEEQRIIHSEATRFLSRLELETAARIARSAAQLGFLTATMANKPVNPSDVQQFFPDLDKSNSQPGQWGVTVTANQVVVSLQVDPRADELPPLLYQELLRSCARALFALAGSGADTEGNILRLDAIETQQLSQSPRFGPVPLSSGPQR